MSLGHDALLHHGCSATACALPRISTEQWKEVSLQQSKARNALDAIGAAPRTDNYLNVISYLVWFRSARRCRHFFRQNPLLSPGLDQTDISRPTISSKSYGSQVEELSAISNIWG